jgi:outer membrane protein assembly factor BamB
MRELLPILLLACPLGHSAQEENWPQFRGPRGAGHAVGAGLPVRWSETENVRWKTAIHGKGWSSPVIWGNQIWLTTATPEGHEMFAICVDRTSGKILHDLKVFDVASPAFCHPFNSYASPTPVIEAGRVYVHFGCYGTACLDTATGKVLWTRRDLPCDHFRGPGSSPILYEDLLIVAFDGFDVQYVVALDKATGKTVWKKDRDIDYGTTNSDYKKAFATAAVVEVNGKTQVICPSAGATIAYEPRTGDEIWRVRHGGMNVAAPPQFGQGKAFLCTGDGGSRLLAVRPDGRGDVTATHIDWTYNKMTVPSRCTPLLIDDLLYLVHEKGIASCLEAKTGQQVWQHRLDGDFSTAPLYAGGHIYFCSQAGATYIMAPGRTPKIVAVNKFDDGFMASPAVADGALFLRTKTHLYRIQQSKP